MKFGVNTQILTLVMLVVFMQSSGFDNRLVIAEHSKL